jgi:hypothetical protein
MDGRCERLVVSVGLGLPEVCDGLLERRPEPLHVEADLLLVEVCVLERVPALALDTFQVSEDGVVTRELVHQRALLRLDPVLQVPMAQLATNSSPSSGTI